MLISGKKVIFPFLSQWFLRFLRNIVLPVSFSPGLVFAEDVGNFDMYFAEADAIVPVEVAFVPYGDMVLLGEPLTGELIELSSTSELLGECLPNKARVREWATSQQGSSQGDVYAEAVERATYKVIAFLKHTEDGSEVICASGAHSTENWESDPRFKQWKAKLDRFLNDKD